MSGSGIGQYTTVDMKKTVTVQARDSNSNDLKTGNSYFYLEVDKLGTSIQMTDLVNGSYSATYTASTAGTIKVSVYQYQTGLFAEYFPYKTFEGNPTTRVDANINFNWIG